jgi:hypothetical protein
MKVKNYSRRGLIKSCLILWLAFLVIKVYPQCTNSSAAYLNYYSKQAFYKPTLNDPLITVKLTYHVFIDGNGNGYDPNNPTAWAVMQWLSTHMTDGYERYSEQRNATFAPNFNPPFTANFGGLMDSRVRYEVTNVYIYTNASLYASTNSQAIIDHINSVDPTRIKEGLPIIYNGAGFIGYTGHASTYNSLPFVHTSAGAGAGGWWVSQHLRHEIGHVMGWKHMYAAGGTGENISPCNNNDFLSDVFPMSSNPNCLPNTCTGCYYYEDNTNYSNNTMCANAITLGNQWTSELQMARRIRNLHLLHNNVRNYVKDMKSEWAHPWLITSNETWDFDIQMYRDIVVKTGNTLIIQCKVAMATDGKITVEKGAKLIVTGNGEITSWCKTTPAGSNYNVPLWTGIEVDGNPAQNQLINNMTGYCANQGIVEVKNGGKISYAMKGINTSRTNPAGGGWINNTSGGIVITNGATFENNVFDIVFYKYQQATIRSKIENTTFITSGKIGVDGNNALINPLEHIKLYENWGLTIKGCQFTYAAGAIYPDWARGSGVYTTDSHFTIDQLNANTQTYFTDLREGIYIDNGNPVFTATIRNSKFNGNQYGTKVENCHYLLFYDNIINVPANQVGVYLYRSKYYNVRNNTITGTGMGDSGIGIVAFDSKTGAHQIYRNTISALYMGIHCVDDNGGYSFGTYGLKMNCNVFNSGSPNLFDIAMMSSDGIVMPIVMTEQSSLSPASAFDYVRNQYGAVYLGQGIENKWYVDWMNNQTLHHSGTFGGVDNPDAPFNQASSQVFIGQYGYPFNFNTHCPAWTSSDGGNAGSMHDKLVIMNDHITNQRNLGLATSFKIQATVSSKLNLFLTDTLPESNDSIVAILENNQGGMDDADIQLVFAHLRNENYGLAEEKTIELPVAKADWKGMLGAISDLKQSPDNIYEFLGDANNLAFMSAYANTEDRDGQACAQGMLSFMGINHAFPVVYPPIDERLAQVTNLAKKPGGLPVSLYPNPATSGLTIENLDKGRGTLTLELTDVLGKVVLTQIVNNPDKHYVPLNGLDNGVYLLKVNNERKEVVYKSKVIKQD